MLSPKVETLIRESIDVYLKAQGFRPPRFGQRVLAQSFAGQTIQPAKVAAVTAKEIEAISIGLVNAIRNVVETFEMNPYEDLENDLLRIFDSEFDRCAEAIRNFGSDTFKRLSANASAPSWVDDRLFDARQARHVDLKLLAAEVLKSGRENTAKILYNSQHQQAGIVERNDEWGDNRG